MHEYIVEVSGDSLVEISYGTNNNHHYTGKVNEDAIGDECEFKIYWQFSFDGQKLHFVRESSAG
jgi:hypothetical protein